jgi:allantoin racemase
MDRVLVIVPYAFDDAEAVGNREAQLKSVKLGPDISFEFRPVKAGPAMFDSYHDWLLADLAMFEAGLNAQEEGFSAVCIDTVSDSGMNALRSVLDIPVIAPARASYHTALMLGNRFCVITQWDPWIAEAWKTIKEYGLESKCAAVESINVEPDLENLLGGKEDEIFPKLLEASHRAIDRGADVVTLGSTTMHQSAAYLAEHLPVPVLNPGPLTYKLAELCIGLKVSHSRKAYQAPRVEKREMVHAMLKAAAQVEGSYRRV